MFNEYRNQMFTAYNQAREHFIKNWQELVAIENKIHSLIGETIQKNISEIVADYNEASYLYAFWQNYPPEDRGRSPKGDQFPWIEVGEHSIGFKLARLLSNNLKIREIGLPFGTDQRFLLESDYFENICKITKRVMLFIDVKSVGPRDDADHTVLSPYQVSGDGIWKSESAGVKNTVMSAQGSQTTHPFHCALPPIYVTSNGMVAPTVSVFIKPVYHMNSLGKENSGFKTGQPLKCVTIVTLPNGLLLTTKPNYLAKHPGLFFPGKDDKKKEKTKLRARVSFSKLREIDSWRVETVCLP